MKDFAGRTAVVTGGGSGMGRELVRQLVAEACNVAMCDVFASGIAESSERAYDLDFFENFAAEAGWRLRP